MSTSGAGWVHLPPEAERPKSAARIMQQYEGHGVAVPPPLDRGFPKTDARPPSAPTGEPEPHRRHRLPQEKRAQLVVHAHIREKEIDINVGAGGQRVFWLAVTACQRYLHNPGSYGQQFAGEFTPVGVLVMGDAGKPERLDNRAILRDELAGSLDAPGGAHVWIDVGDGVALSSVTSRPILGIC